MNLTGRQKMKEKRLNILSENIGQEKGWYEIEECISAAMEFKKQELSRGI